MSNRPHHRRRKPLRPTQAELDKAARASALILGCTCTEIDVATAGHTRVSIGHDTGCPAEHAGHVGYLIVRRHP